jgi:DNA-3-methyladenine glycosylase I
MLRGETYLQELDGRCDWCLGEPVYQQYHDEVWGVPQFDAGVLFEFLLLEGAQAGLSWITILKRRENYRRAFDNFNPLLIADYGDQKKQLLLADAGIIRNKLKIDSASLLQHEMSLKQA